MMGSEFRLTLLEYLNDYAPSSPPPRPLIWVNFNTYSAIKNTFNHLNLQQYTYVILEGEDGLETHARLLPWTDPDKFAYGSSQALTDSNDNQCIISSILYLSLFKKSAYHVTKGPKTIKIKSFVCASPEKPLPTATKIVLSVTPCQYPTLQKTPTANTPLDGSMSAFLAATLLSGTIVCKSSFSSINWFNKISSLYVANIISNSWDDHAVVGRPHVVRDNTEIEFVPWNDSFISPSSQNNSNGLKVTYEECISKIKAEVGGLDSVINKTLTLIFESSKSHPSRLPRGFLFSGISGTGKTYLASKIATHLGIATFSVNAPDLFKSGEGQSEDQLSAIFSKALEASPSLIVIDELESIASSRQKMEGIIEKRMLNHLLLELDRLAENPSALVFVIGITSSIGNQDPALIRARRLEEILNFNIPSPDERMEILKIQTRNFPEFDSGLLQKIRDRTPGFTGSDLSNLVRQALLYAIQKSVLNTVDMLAIESAEKAKLNVDFSHFEESLQVIRASALSEYSTRYDETSFDSLRGIDDIIATLKASVLMPFSDPKRFSELGAKPPSGVLLYGPPGVGKSKVVMALASACKINFLSIQSTEILSKVVGQSEQALKRVFTAARAAAPCILFLDQVDAIAQQRGSDNSEENSSDRILSLLLTEMDGMGSSSSEHLLVIAATNKPETLDSAVLRPGRFDNIIFLPPPDVNARLAIIERLATLTPCDGVSAEQWLSLAKQTRGFTGADLESLFREASYLALKYDINSTHITWEQLQECFGKVPASCLKLQITHPYNKQAGFTFLS